MTDSTLTPPPGWYPDPDDAAGQRYWDGSSWGAGSDVKVPAALAVQKQKTLGKAYLWWFPLGIFGAHHFYMGRKVWGWITALTLNFLLLGWALDLLLMPMWLSHLEKDRRAVEEMREIWVQTSAEIKAAGRDIGSASAEVSRALGPAAAQAARKIGPATLAASSWITQAVRLGGLALNRDKTELSYGALAVPASMAQVSVMSGTATSRMSGSNVLGGAVLGGMLGHAGAGAVIGATARTNTTKIFIVVDFPGGQWVTETSHKNERYARRFAAKLNNL
ncbi:TM2 domain-containing membrane protein YozV [Microbacterium phyllosphaerae]|uniref:TM2 domain-containing membrane protein YozV n=1 Tax=Microbacterium phyllosphaerae TaxID=124798 RepID=A0ABS4WKX2_9MICO|nr:NINE protein [Microbacterium phyllosphaerae]MBP2376850.1 TM2 domain-containing membrane protein YozV [Microbacterium phyllosphaerae]